MKSCNIYLQLIILTIAICSTACNKNKEKTTEIVTLDNIQAKEVAISQITSGHEVVPLETTDDCLISYIRGFEFDNESIYILDGIFEGIFVFDRQGKYKRKLSKQGRGAGEYMVINGFAVDQKEQTIEVLDDNTKKILVYDLYTFEFIKEIPIPLSIAFGFDKKEGIYYFQTNRLKNEINGKKTNSDIIAFNPVTKKTTPLFDETLPDDVNRTFSMKGISKNGNNQLFYSRTWHDQFYEIDKETATPILTIDAGKYSAPENIKQGTFEQQEEYMNSDDDASHYLLLRLALYDTNKMIISFSKGARPFDTYYYIRIGDQTHLTNRIVLDHIEGKPELSPNNAFIAGNNIIFRILPDETHPQPLKDHLKKIGVKEQDNPVLFIYSI